MKPQFQHEANTSFALWLDQYLTCKGEAFSNHYADLYYHEDETMPMYPQDENGYISYNSPYKQWVYNSDINNAVIPTGVYINTGDGVYNFCNRGESGLMIDFDNGRILLEGKYFPNNYNQLEIEAEFSVKDINIYLADDTEENIIIENKYNINSRTIPEYLINTGVNPYEKVSPAAFISMERSQNQPFAFGGEDLTTLNYRVVFFAEDLYQLDGIMSLCTDSYNLSVRNIGYDSHPFNEFGDLKTGYYSYNEQVDASKNCKPLMFIEDTRSSKINDKLTKKINPGLYLGFVDFDVSQARFPRS